MRYPITNQQKLIDVVKYIASESSKMVEEILGITFPIKSITVFAHSQSEFELLITILEKMGKSYSYNNGPRIELSNPIKAGNNMIVHLRVRKPDFERPQAGCNDFETDFNDFKNTYLPKYPNNLTFIKRPDYEMIELHHESFDVLAYVVSS